MSQFIYFNGSKFRYSLDKGLSEPEYIIEVYNPGSEQFNNFLTDLRVKEFSTLEELKQTIHFSSERNDIKLSICACERLAQRHRDRKLLGD